MKDQTLREILTGKDNINQCAPHVHAASGRC